MTDYLTCRNVSFSASDSYAEMNHYLNEVPCLVVVRMKMHRNGDEFFADGVGRLLLFNRAYSYISGVLRKNKLGDIRQVLFAVRKSEIYQKYFTEERFLLLVF